MSFVESYQPLPKITLEEARAEIAGLSLEERQARWRVELRIHRDTLLRLGVLLVSIEQDGGKVDGPAPLLKLLREVGQGTLLPEIITHCGDYISALNHARKLSLEEQAKLLEISPRKLHLMTLKVRNPGGQGSLQDDLPEGRKVGFTVPSLRSIAGRATAQEIVEMCMTLVANHPDPAGTAAMLTSAIRRAYPRPSLKVSP